MYLVELRPGKEELYRSGEELAAAIRSGEVDNHSRIYHRATSKWISVTLHPHYKAIAAERESPGPSQAPAGEHRQNWTFFNAASETLKGANDTPPPPVESDRDEGDDHQWRRPIALSVTGLLLILGMQLAFFGPRPPWASRQASADLPQATASPTAIASQAPSPSLVSLASTSWTSNEEGDWDGSSEANGAGRDAPAPAVLPRAPSIRRASLSQALGARGKPAASAKADASVLGSFLRRWTAAQEEANARMQSGIRVSRLNQLFSPARLTPNGGVADTRIAIAGAANFIRVYREQRLAIDREFQDSFVVMARENKLTPAEIRQWYAKPTPREMPALATLTSTILTGMDSLLSVLNGQAGAYRVVNETIHFEDQRAAQTYGQLRQEIAKAVDVAKASGGADSTGPMALLLESIGSTRLPKES